MEYAIITVVIAYIMIKVWFSLTEKRYYAAFGKEDPTEKKFLKNLFRRSPSKKKVAK